LMNLMMIRNTKILIIEGMISRRLFLTCELLETLEKCCLEKSHFYTEQSLVITFIDLILIIIFIPEFIIWCHFSLLCWLFKKYSDVDPCMIYNVAENFTELALNNNHSPHIILFPQSLMTWNNDLNSLKFSFIISGCFVCFLHLNLTSIWTI
jgi:hypothetical protein